MQKSSDPVTAVVIAPTQPEHAPQLEDIQCRVYGIPQAEIRDTYWLHHDTFVHHTQIFPEGQFVALNGDAVLGHTTSMRIKFDPAHPFIEPWRVTISDGWLHRHHPEGEWMYGVESCVLPEYWGQGIGSKLMDARFEVARRLNLRGIVAGSGMISYFQHYLTHAPEAYVEAVKRGEIFDINLTKQIKKGFVPGPVIPNYLTDEFTRGWGVVIVWENPHYRP